MANKIQWLADGETPLPSLDFDFIESWLDRVGERNGRILGEVSYLFCDDEKILAVNREFLQHDYYTDIITFDYCRGKLLRVIVHGILHLCGINDKGPGEREVMEAHEDAALALYDVMCRNRMLEEIPHVRVQLKRSQDEV